ncbi:MAG TPA: hypothetical protein VN845_05650 [Solirubrobacteraceae bacterium]|nr:hypothetical protein [Solirubrobacteraceae bacterium]
MRHITYITVCLLVFGIATFIADIALTLVGASLGWYYGVGLCLTALTVFRILSPTGRVPIARLATRRRRAGEKHLPRPIH